MSISRPLSVLAWCLCAAITVGHAASEKKEHQKTVERFKLPDLTLLNQDRQPLKLRDLDRSPKPVMLEFIFATCQTICPILSAGFMNLQKELGDEVDSVRLVSISIDPQHDTPEVMKKYLERYRARPGWDFLTGERSDIDNVLLAFDCYVPNKMLHEPLTFLRKPGADHWIRIQGLLSGKQLMQEYRGLVSE